MLQDLGRVKKGFNGIASAFKQAAAALHQMDSEIDALRGEVDNLRELKEQHARAKEEITERIKPLEDFYLPTNKRCREEGERLSKRVVDLKERCDDKDQRMDVLSNGVRVRDGEARKLEEQVGRHGWLSWRSSVPMQRSGSML